MKSNIGINTFYLLQQFRITEDQFYLFYNYCDLIHLCFYISKIEANILFNPLSEITLAPKLILKIFHTFLQRVCISIRKTMNHTDNN